MSPLGAAPPAVAELANRLYAALVHRGRRRADCPGTQRTRRAACAVLGAARCRACNRSWKTRRPHIRATWSNAAILPGDPAWLKPSSRELEVPGLVVNRNPQLPVRLHAVR
jgi:hypothetical protein